MNQQNQNSEQVTINLGNIVEETINSLNIPSSVDPNLPVLLSYMLADHLENKAYSALMKVMSEDQYKEYLTYRDLFPQTAPLELMFKAISRDEEAVGKVLENVMQFLDKFVKRIRAIYGL